MSGNTLVEPDFKELVTIEYLGFEISYHDWKTTELCIVHNIGKDDYLFDGTAIECFNWVNSRLRSLEDE